MHVWFHFESSKQIDFELNKFEVIFVLHKKFIQSFKTSLYNKDTQDINHLTSKSILIIINFIQWIL